MRRRPSSEGRGGSKVRNGAGPDRVPPGLRTSPTGRVPQWVLDEASGRAPITEPWRTWSPAPSSTSPARPGRRRLMYLVTALAGVAVVSAVVFDSRGIGGVAGDARPANWPTPGFEAADAPLGTPVPAPSPGGTHLFVGVQDDGEQPVAYDPCRPVHYVIRPDNAPPGADALVHEAFARVSHVTGLQFVYDGATDESAWEDRASFQPDRYGDRWAPVLVSWQTEAENPELAGHVAGLAGSASVEPPVGPRVFVTGVVGLDAAAFRGMLADPARVSGARAVLLHELAHLVGLAHVADPSELMYPTTSTVLDFGVGDLTGLYRLGGGECVPTA